MGFSDIFSRKKAARLVESIDALLATIDGALLVFKDGVKDMREYLLALKMQGKTIIIASHSAEDIDILCDTVSEMDKGRLETI